MPVENARLRSQRSEQWRLNPTLGRRRQSRRLGEALDGELAALLEVERFEPPAEFRERALLNDPAVYERAARDPQAWWAEQARALHWFKPWDTVLDDSNPPFYKWFVGGELNVSYNCLDRHVEAGRGERVAFHWRGEDGSERDITYAELLAEVQRFANALKDLGVRKGDVVGIYLPMIPEVVVAMLACARIGAPHNVVFGGFSAEAVRERMEFSEAKVADHRRRRRAQGQDGAGEGPRRRGRWATCRRSRRSSSCAARARRVRCGRAATSTTTRSSRRPTPTARPSRWTPSTRCTSSTPPARRPSRRASCTPPAAI